MFPLSALTLVKLGVLLLGLFNLACMLVLKGRPSEARHLHLTNDPALHLRHLAIPRTAAVPLLTEESAHYPIAGPRADAEWASLVPEGNHGLVLLGPDADARPYAVAMFHTLHCLDRIRRAIVDGPAASSPHGEPPESAAHARYHVHHCFNYVRQMVLCAANTRLSPADHVLPSGMRATDGIGLRFACRDWNAVYAAFEANSALNRTMAFTT